MPQLKKDETKPKVERIMIEIDPEFKVVLDRLREKVKKATWDGLDKVPYKNLTKIIARKINASKLF